MATMGDEALIGRVLDGRYRVGDRIARGGMASVFHGTDERLDRDVAIKVMHQGMGDDEQFTQRFEREARSAAKLNHRNVVSVFDQGRDGDVTYLVMEYVPGRTLRDIMRDEAPMAPARALELVAEVLTALSAAHRAHLVHRDIKPENVLITPDGDVKVADFGLARAVSAATTATGGTLIGTVSYMAPEIVLNDGTDARSDVYACGAMLFEMLTGAKPHTGDSPIQVAYKHVHSDVPAPSSIEPDVPDYVDALVARATSRDRDQRASDARVLLQLVRRVQGAVAAGLTTDPELVQDLLPRERPTEPVDADDEVTQAVTASPDDPTVTVRRPVPGAEPTMQWSSTEWQGAPASAAGATHPTGLHPAMTREQYGESSAAGSSRRGRLLLVLALAAALVVGLLAYWVGIGRYTDAPQLVGRSEKQAVAEAEKAGFTLEVSGRKFSETAPLGTVISTDPGPGDRILPGGTIDAVISRGKERYAVPALKGKTLEEAKETLEGANLRLGDAVERYDEDIPKGRIVRPVDVSRGDRVKRDTVVDVVVSQGKRPIPVQDYTGKKGSDARAALEEAGFTVVVEQEFSDDVDKGDVIGQSPKEGTRFRGDRITLTVSRGPEEIEVPDVVGQSASKARKTLEDAGFKVRVIRPLPGNTVRIQSPGAGNKAKVGSTVSIVTGG